MKLAQYYDGDSVRIGLVTDIDLVPLKFEGDMIDFIRDGGKPKPGGLDAIPLEEVRWAPPVAAPSKIMAIGLNYRDHASESKGKIPEVPLVFAKFPNSLIGHQQKITWPTGVTRKVDFEAELAVIMGKTIRNCSEADAPAAVFGYTCANDVSARDLQFGDGQWVRGKSLDGFCPLGPWIVTAEEVPDPHNLKIQCRLNGRVMQDSHTGLMIFTAPTLISFLSRHFTLLAGDVILTGTPRGVGAFRDPPVYLGSGDEVTVDIEGIGSLTNTCLVI